MISIRRVTIGGGYRYLINSVAAGDGNPEPSKGLAHYYASTGTPPGVFLGVGLADLDGGKGVEQGSQVSEEHLWNMLVSLLRSRQRRAARIASEGSGSAALWPASIFAFSPRSRISVLWALADDGHQTVIADCHRQAIDYVISYAEGSVSLAVLARTGSSKRTSPASSQPRSPTSRAGRTIPSCTAMSWSGIERDPCRTASGGPWTQGHLQGDDDALGAPPRCPFRPFDPAARARLGGAGTASLGEAAL